jgi:hypothetical protein
VAGSTAGWQRWRTAWRGGGQHDGTGSSGSAPRTAGWQSAHANGGGVPARKAGTGGTAASVAWRRRAAPPLRREAPARVRSSERNVFVAGGGSSQGRRWVFIPQDL